MFTENYIKMCEKAEGIQNLWRKPFKNYIGDLFWKGKEYLAIPEACSYVTEIMFEPKDDFIWLPTQEKLQEMSGLDWWKFDKRCNEIRQCILEDPLSEIEIKTKEEIGICVLMEKKYNKIWNGEKWIKGVK